MCSQKTADIQEEINKFVHFVMREKGVDLSLYRATFLNRRLRMRINYRGAESIFRYMTILKNDPEEWNNFLESLSINVSMFFRDREVFDFFNKYCLKEIVRSKELNKERIIRLWSAGCSFGEEPYTLAMMLLHFLKDKKSKIVPRVLATDVDAQALEAAKRGIFKEGAVKNVPPLMLREYFSRTSEGKWIISDSVRRIVIFKKHNLLDEPPSKYMDAIFFRNVKIYFDTKQAQEVSRRIYNALRNNGYLILGKVETMPTFLKKYFVDTQKCYKIFQKKSEAGQK